MPDPSCCDSKIRLPIRPNDFDYAGYLNNAVYVEYLEAGRVAWAEANGLDLFQPLLAPAVFRLELDYLKGVIRGQEVPEVIVHTTLSEQKPMRLLFSQTISNIRDELCARAVVQMVWVNLQTKKAVPVQAALAAIRRPR